MIPQNPTEFCGHSKKYYQITTAMNDGTIAALSAAEYIRQMDK